MIAELITVGVEGTDPAYAQRNEQFLADELAALGTQLRWSSHAGEDRLRLQRGMARALERCDFLFLVGGMEPGGFTRETVAEGLGLRLAPHQPTLARVRAIFGQRDGRLPPQYAALGMAPEGAVVFENQYGLSLGCALAAGRQCIVLLPAAPQELRPMMVYGVYRFLMPLLNQGAAVHSLRAYGIRAKEAAATLSDLLESKNPLLALYPEEDELLLRVTARARTQEQAERLCASMLRDVAGRLDGAVYGAEEDSLQQGTVDSLRRTGKRAAGVEYGTGGLLGKLLGSTQDAQGAVETVVWAQRTETLTDVLGVRTKDLKSGPCDPKAVAAAAAGAARTFDAGLGVAVALSGEKDRACAAVSDGVHVWLREIPTTGDKPARTACKAALDLLRLYAAAPERLPEPILAPRTSKVKPGKAAQAAAPAPPVTHTRWYQNLLPWKGDSRAQLVRKGVLLAASLVLVCSLAYMAQYYLSGYLNIKMVASMETLFAGARNQALNLPEGYPLDYLPQFSPWWEINEDVAGRVEIDDTPLKYAAVQAKDNDYYLRRTFYRKNDQHGVPFVDCRVDLKKESDNTVIYGHNMDDGQIFGELMYYKGIDYYRQHPVIRFDSVYRESEYKIISVFVTNTLPEHGEVWRYHDFIDGTDAEFQAYVDKARERSFYETTVDVKPGDKLLTLSTCSYVFQEARLVVVARKVRKGESAEVDVAGARVAANPVIPPAYFGGKAPVPAASNPVSSMSSAPEQPASSTPPATPPVHVSMPSTPESSVPPPPPSSVAPPSSTAPPSSVAPPSAPSSSPPVSEAPPSSAASEPNFDDAWLPNETPDEESSTPSEPSEPESEGSDYEEEEEEDSSGGPIAMDEEVLVNGIHMSAFDAVCQMTMNETGGSFHKEAIKAQAVAIYSKLVARGGNLSGIGLRDSNSAVEKAVRAVWGDTVRKGGKAIDVYFSASSAGVTNTSKEVWGGTLPGHTENVDSHWDESSPGFRSTKRMSRDDVIERVYKHLQVDLEGLDEEEWFEVLSRTGGDYIDKIRIGGEKTTTGRMLRESILNLRSACFEWEFKGDDVVFTTYGYGHGCGLSQYGANGMAGEGSDYVEILEHYYAGCTVG